MSLTRLRELRARLEQTETVATTERQISDKLLEIVKELQWSDHHYDPAHSHSYSCPICGGCDPKGDLRSVTSDFGHREDCSIGKVLKEVDVFRAKQGKEKNNG